MRRPGSGFTIIEVIIAILIGAILTSLAIRGFGSTQSQLAVRQARNVFQGMMARTRAHAIEGGVTTRLILNADGDSVMIFKGSTLLENVRFGQEMGVDIQASASVIRVCMNPRGFADTSCNSFSSPVKVTFTQGAQSESLEILPLGQLRW